MPSKKQLLEKIESLEHAIEHLVSDVRELQNDLSHDIEVRKEERHPLLGFPINNPGTFVTTNGKINAILYHLNLEITAVPPKNLPPSIEVKKTVTPRKRKAAKKGVEGEKSSKTA